MYRLWYLPYAHKRLMILSIIPRRRQLNGSIVVSIKLMRVYLDVSLTLLSWKTTHFMCSLVGLQGGRRALEMNSSINSWVVENQTQTITKSNKTQTRHWWVRWVFGFRTNNLTVHFNTNIERTTLLNCNVRWKRQKGIRSISFCYWKMHPINCQTPEKNKKA